MFQEIIIPPSMVDEEWFKYNDYYSKSRIGSYDFCQLQFKKQYVDKTLKVEPNHVMSYGTRFHEFAEAFVQMAPKYPVEKWHKFVHDSYTEEEKVGLHWFIDEHAKIYKDINILACEYKCADHTNKLRGAIDRIDQVKDNTIRIIEYKTSASFKEKKLMFEFGFYKVLLKNQPWTKDLDFEYCVINPRIREIHHMKPSRDKTILDHIAKANESIKTGNFKPKCTNNYKMDCDICTPEELLLYGVGEFCNGE